MQHHAGSAGRQQRRFTRQYAIAMRIRPAGELARTSQQDQRRVFWRRRNDRRRVSGMGAGNNAAGSSQGKSQSIRFGQVSKEGLDGRASRMPLRWISYYRHDL
jgi:hypothetical protein